MYIKHVLFWREKRETMTCHENKKRFIVEGDDARIVS